MIMLILMGLMAGAALVLLAVVGRKSPGTVKKAAERAGADLGLVQRRMPVADISGHFAFMKDGSLRGYMVFPGINHSVDTEKQMISAADADADILAGIDVEFMIAKYPVRISSSRQLVLVDRAIARERAAMFDSRTPEMAASHARRVQILEEHVRASAQRESLSGSRVSWPSWMILYFPAGTDAADADRAMRNIIRTANAGKSEPPRFATENEVRELWQLYFTPNTINPRPAPANQPVLPEPEGASRRRGRRG